MKKRTLLSASMALLLIINNKIVFAEPVSSESQIIQENKVKYEQLDNKTIELDAEVSKLNAEIENLNTQLADANFQINSTEDEITLINHKIEESKEKIKEKQELIDGRIRFIYKNNMTVNMVNYLINSENIFDIFNRIQDIDKIISLDKEMILEIKEQRDSLDKNAKKVEEKQEDLKVLKESIQGNLAEITNKKDEQEKLLADLNSRKDEIMTVIEVNEEKLISYPISVINSESSSTSEIQDAVNTLQYILPQLNSDYVIGLANNSIALGNEKIVENETISVLSSSVGSNSKYLASYSMAATAYTGHNLTAMGLKPTYNPNGLSTVAVDPKVIPLGSKVYVDGYGYAIASDTGGAIKGNKIDLYMNSTEECLEFGRRTVSVNVIAYPGEW